MNYITKNILRKSAVGLIGAAFLTTPIFAAEQAPASTTVKGSSESTMKIEKKMEHTEKKDAMMESKATLKIEKKIEHAEKKDAIMESKAEKMNKKMEGTHTSSTTMGTTTKKMPTHKMKKAKKSHTKDMQTSSSTVTH